MHSEKNQDDYYERPGVPKPGFLSDECSTSSTFDVCFVFRVAGRIYMIFFRESLNHSAVFDFFFGENGAK